MAEYCKDCFIRVFHPTKSEIRRIVLCGKNHLDFCEGCGKYKQVVIAIRPSIAERLEQLVRNHRGY